MTKTTPNYVPVHTIIASVENSIKLLDESSQNNIRSGPCYIITNKKYIKRSNMLTKTVYIKHLKTRKFIKKIHKYVLQNQRNVLKLLQLIQSIMMTKQKTY